ESKASQAARGNPPTQTAPLCTGGGVSDLGYKFRLRPGLPSPRSQTCAPSERIVWFNQISRVRPRCCDLRAAIFISPPNRPDGAARGRIGPAGRIRASPKISGIDASARECAPYPVINETEFLHRDGVEQVAPIE